MKQFEFNDKKYQLPESWKEVTLAQLVKLMKAEREEENELLKAARIISILSGLDYNTLINSDSILTMTLFGALTFLDDKEVEGENSQHFKLVSDTFYVNTLEGSVFKEFATFQKIDSDFAKNSEDGLALKLATLCRLKGETFLQVEDKLEERAKLFEALDAETVFRINSFFLLRTKLSAISTAASLSLLKERQEKEQKLLELLTANSAGSPWRSGMRVRLHKWILSTLSRRQKS